MLFYLIQFTWGIFQNLLGLFLFIILYLKHKVHKIEKFRHCYVIHCSMNGCMSLGIFIFYNHHYSRRILFHEYGHSIQSLILGPLFLLFIGIPSFVWCNGRISRNYRKSKHYDYYRFYTEKWANQLANRYL